METASMAEKMGEAVINTILGMGTVFIVLIFLSFVISLFKFIGAAGKKKEQAVAATAPTVAAPVAEVSLTDDLELVAVITAAIAASMGGTSTDGLMVRSIRKIGRK